MSKELFLSTDMFDPKIRDEFWRAAVKPIYDVSDIRNPDEKGFAGTMRSRPLGVMTIGATTFNGQIYRRTRNVIAQGGMDHYLIQVLIAGRLWGDFNNVDVAARPGDIVIIDLAQVVNSEAEAGARISVILPRAELEKAAGGRNLHGMVLPGTGAGTRLLIEYLKGLSDVFPQLNAAEIEAAEQAMLTLLVACVNRMGQSLPDMPVNQPMRRRVLDYIDANLANPLFGPPAIMQYFRISRSHLYRMFETDGGVARVVRDKRLDLAYRMLINRTGKPLSLKEISYHCGFHDGTQFGKLFKARFGMTPREAREMAIPLPPETGVLTFQDHLSSQAARRGVAPA